jgi:hypothetical protein
MTDLELKARSFFDSRNADYDFEVLQNSAAFATLLLSEQAESEAALSHAIEVGRVWEKNVVQRDEEISALTAENAALKAKLEAAYSTLGLFRDNSGEMWVRQQSNFVLPNDYTTITITEKKEPRPSESLRVAREALLKWDNWFCSQSCHKRDGISEQHPLAIGRHALSHPLPEQEDKL